MIKWMKVIFGFLSIAFLLTMLLMIGFQNRLDESIAIVETIPVPNTREEEKTIITLVHDFNDVGGAEWIVETTKLFERTHVGIEFKIITVDGENYDRVLNRMYASGSMPDIYFTNNLLNNVEYIQEGYAINLTNEKFLYNNFIPGSLKGSEYMDNFYAVPVTLEAYGVIYNRSYFNKVGISNYPETYDEFIACCVKLREGGYIPVVGGFEENWTVLADLDADLKQSAYFNNTDWRVSIENDLYFWKDDFFRFGGALDRFSERLQYYNEDVLTTNWFEATKMVADGQAAMIINNTGAISAIRSHNESIDIGFFSLPWSNIKEHNLFPISTTKGVVGNAKSKNLDIVMEILAHFASKEVGELAQKHINTIPLVKGVNTEYDIAYDEFWESFEKGKIIDYSNFIPKFRNNQLNQLFAETMLQFIDDKERDAETYLRILDQGTQEIIIAN